MHNRCSGLAGGDGDWHLFPAAWNMGRAILLLPDPVTGGR